MTYLKDLKYRQKISISFGILIAILIISALITSIAVNEIIQQFDKQRRVEQVIHSIEETRLLVSDYIRQPSRENARVVHQYIKQTRQKTESIVRTLDSISSNNMLRLLDEFQIQFRKFVIQADQAAALKSQANDLGKSMVTQITEVSGKLTQTSSIESLTPVTNQILNILWQGQALMSGNQLLSQEQLAPIQHELKQLGLLFQKSSQGTEDERFLYRIHRNTRDYVGSFEKFLEYDNQIHNTNEVLNSTSVQIRDTGNHLASRIRNDIEKRLYSSVFILISFFAIFIVIALFLSRFLAREIVSPVNNLVKATKEIAGGNLSVEVTSNIDDELGELASCLNYMAKNLQISHTSLTEKNQALTNARQELEKRVQQRTKELATANTSLEAEVLSRIQSENQIRASEAKFRAMFELSPLGIIRSTLDGKILECNQSFASMLEYTSEQIVNHSESEFTPELLRPLDQEKLKQLKKKRQYGPVEKELIRASGKPIAVRINGALISSESEDSVWSIVEDITQQKRSEEVIWRQANFDALTGLPNRRMFQNRLELEIRHAERTETKFALMLLDLDKFKEVNDTLGHDQGDLLLMEAAKRIKSCVRESDEVARLGGGRIHLNNNEYSQHIRSLQD